MEQNLRLLGNILALSPQGISIDLMERIYPSGLLPEKQKDCDLFINQVLLLFHRSAESNLEKLDDKERIVKAKEDTILKMEDRIADLKERCDIAKSLEDSRKPSFNQKWGTVTRSQAWDRLTRDGLVTNESALPKPTHRRSNHLTQSFGKVDPASWSEEIDMYPDIIKAIRDGLYDGEKDIFVVDTHSKGSFHADISVAHHTDGRLPYCLRYFLELKLPKTKLDTAENCGQILDYFNAVREKQSKRFAFVAILSNFNQSLVFIANYHDNKVTLVQRWAETIADAVIFAHNTSEAQYLTKIPVLDGRFGGQYDIIALSTHHFLLSVPKPKESSIGTATRGHRHQTRSKAESSSASVESWREPSRHVLSAKKCFVMKVGLIGTSVSNEIALLKKIQTSDCPHLPEIVWSSPDGRELGIVPLGVPINFREPQVISRLIVQQLMDGLKFLHNIGIVHRDIRPCNLILDYSKSNGRVNTVIVDYETSVLPKEAPGPVPYLGGCISWPLRLLKHNTSQYIPEAEDDLFASILLVLHMLFPLQFDAFRAKNVGVFEGEGNSTDETSRLMDLWDDIERSRIWNPFVKAAKEKDYEFMKGMAEVFCRI